MDTTQTFRPIGQIDYPNILSNAFRSCVSKENISDPMLFAIAVSRFYKTLLPDWRNLDVEIDVGDSRRVTINLRKVHDELHQLLKMYNMSVIRDNNVLQKLAEKKLRINNELKLRIIEKSDMLFDAIIKLLHARGYIEYGKTDSRGGLVDISTAEL